MPTPLMKTDVTTCSITTTRSGNADGWRFYLRTADAVTTFGSIYDNANSFSDGSTSTSKALRIDVTEDSDTIAIQSMDSITVDGLVIWLPAMSADDILYVDTEGNTWYDEALTSLAAGLLDEVSDGATIADSLFIGSAFFSETAISITDALTETITDYLSDSISVSDSISLSLDLLEAYLYDYISIEDRIVGSSNSVFSEDSQVDNTWSEV